MFQPQRKFTAWLLNNVMLPGGFEMEFDLLRCMGDETEIRTVSQM